jgi:transposase
MKRNIVAGPLCAPDGCPMTVEVFEGNLADAATLPGQITKIRERFGIVRVVLVGDRGGDHPGSHPSGSHESFTCQRREASIAQERALDGIYVIRTSLPREILDTKATVGPYKSLSQVEKAFRSLKSIDLKIRPICHRLAERVKAHLFLCMLAYYVEWHLRKAAVQSRVR